MITERQKVILETVVREYVTSASPVSSQVLEERYDFGICPATIRSEMQKLVQDGFLCQPHTSAGRIPTDKGYRFFVNKILENEKIKTKKVSKVEKVLEKEKEDTFKLIFHLSRFLAKNSSSLAIIHLLRRELSWKEGWEEILKEPEFEEKDFVSGFSNLLESFEAYIDNINTGSKITIYIGEENPFTRADSFSIISSRCLFPDNEEGTISLLGPKRMAYKENIDLINSVVKLLEQL